MARNKEGEGASAQLWQYISVMHKAMRCLLNESVVQSPKSTANFLKGGECKKSGGAVSFEKWVKRNLGPPPLEQDLGK